MVHIYGYVPFSTHLILSATNEAEYAALSVTQKALYALIISAGAIDTHPGNPVIAKILSMFPEGTQTRINLDALLSFTSPGP